MRGAFVKLFTDDLCQAIESFHSKSFRVFLRFAVFVLSSFSRCDGKLHYGPFLLAVLHLGITAEIPNQQNFLIENVRLIASVVRRGI
jgi:hypothetical protein